MSVRYNPWGKPIETNGTGNFDASFIGTLIDATTGLIGTCPEFIEGLAMDSMEFILSGSKEP